MSRLANLLSSQALSIMAGRAAAANAPAIDDADPVPARLTEAAQPVFRTSRPLTGACASYAEVAGRQIARMAYGDPAKIDAMVKAIRAAAMREAASGALDVI